MNEIDRLEKIREWLRYHNDYTLTLNPWGIYGCWVAELRKGVTSQPLLDWGATLSGRLDRIELWIAALDNVEKSKS